LASSSWNGEVYGCPTTLSLLTLHFNRAHFEQIGLAAPPVTWDELKGYASELTREGRFGWVCAHGTPGRIGGLASVWIVFLQQAGGRLFGDDGLPAFDDGTGVEALELMVDLMPATHDGAFTQTGIVDATVAFMRGEASMMMNWPFMWGSLQDRELSTVAGSVETALLPAGPAGTASIDSGDGWTIPRKARQQELAIELLGFYLDKRVQRAQALVTGWPPARLSVLEERAIQEALPYAATLSAQARHPFNGFVTPDYDAVTTAIGLRLSTALQGSATASEAVAAAFDDVAGIVKARSD
jgi:multiple sugar transport system substrate-binding protein